MKRNHVESPNSFFIFSRILFQSLPRHSGEAGCFDQKGPLLGSLQHPTQRGYSSLPFSSAEIYSCPLLSMLCPKASDMKNETNKTNFHRGHNVENIASFPLLNQTVEPASPINPPPSLWHHGIHLTSVYRRPTLCQALCSAVVCIY